MMGLICQCCNKFFFSFFFFFDVPNKLKVVTLMSQLSKRLTLEGEWLKWAFSVIMAFRDWIGLCTGHDANLLVQGSCFCHFSLCWRDGRLRDNEINYKQNNDTWSWSWFGLQVFFKRKFHVQLEKQNGHMFTKVNYIFTILNPNSFIKVEWE